MLNKFSLASLASMLVLSSACIINGDGDTGGDESTSSDSNTNGTSSTTSSTSTSTSTSGASTTAADDSSSGGAMTSESGAEGTTGAGGSCGWGRTGDPLVPEGYICGGDGADPRGSFPIDCPEAVELMEGGPCANGDSMIEGPGCCDANGDLWYCQTDDVSEPSLVTEDC